MTAATVTMPTNARTTAKMNATETMTAATMTKNQGNDCTNDYCNCNND